MKPKFQPSPSRISAVQKCHELDARQCNGRTGDQQDQPRRDDCLLAETRDQRAGEKLGPNIAMTCHEMPIAASSGEKPQPTMASGAPVITKLISA